MYEIKEVDRTSVGHIIQSEHSMYFDVCDVFPCTRTEGTLRELFREIETSYKLDTEPEREDMLAHVLVNTEREEYVGHLYTWREGDKIIAGGFRMSLRCIIADTNLCSLSVFADYLIHYCRVLGDCVYFRGDGLSSETENILLSYGFVKADEDMSEGHGCGVGDLIITRCPE